MSSTYISLSVKMKVYITVFLCVFFLRSCYGYSAGAPESVCQNMVPGHRGTVSQTSRPPYQIKARYSDGKVTVSITSSSGERFRGFLVQARDANNLGAIINGTFTPESNLEKTLFCGKMDNSLTHKSGVEKSSLTTTWTPPPKFSGKVIFRATVVQTKAIYWTDIQSSPINVISQSEEEEEDNGSRPLRYRECGKTKSCFGQPGDCVTRGTCNILLTYNIYQDGVRFELYGKLDANNIYVSMGLSDDKFMGDDSVSSCVLNPSGTPEIMHSWNVENNGEKWNEPASPNSQFEVSEQSARAENGDIFCTWKRRYRSMVNGVMFDLKNKTYYVLLAVGPQSSFPGGVIGKHTQYYISNDLLNMSSVQIVGVAGRSDLIKVHGTFMVIAWIGFVSVAILMARYYKQAWGEQVTCNVKIWFAFHRALMLSSVILIIIAFIIIFVYRGGWSSVEPNPHAILGVICTALAIFQPIGALFRPDPQAPKRPIFNWLHWLGGNAAHILAIVTIFFASSLNAAQLPDGFLWTMAVFVIGYCIVHIILQAHTWKLEKKKSNEVKMMEIGSQNANAAANKDIKEAPGSKFRKVMLGVYVLFISILVLALVIIVCQ